MESLQCLSLPLNYNTLSDKIGSRWISLLLVGMSLSLLRLLILTGNASFWTNNMILQADYLVRSISFWTNNMILQADYLVRSIRANGSFK